MKQACRLTVGGPFSFREKNGSGKSRISGDSRMTLPKNMADFRPFLRISRKSFVNDFISEKCNIQPLIVLPHRF